MKETSQEPCEVKQTCVSICLIVKLPRARLVWGRGLRFYGRASGLVGRGK